MYCNISRLQKAVRHLVVHDRKKHLQHLAHKAVYANACGDCHTTAKIVNMLAGKERASTANVKLLDVSIARDDKQESERWQKHFCTVFFGTVCDNSKLLHVSKRPRLSFDASSFRTKPIRTLRFFKRLPKNQGLGSDDISAELLCAGGKQCSIVFDCLHQRIIREGWPLQWCCGRIIDLWKHIGDHEVCDNSKGLLLSDRNSKSFIGQLRSEFEPKHQTHSPCDQYRGMAGGGTDFAYHVVLSFIY